MLVAGGVALVAAAARLARMPWYLMFAALPMLYQQQVLFKGMEAAVALFMLGLFVLTVCLFARSPARWQWPLAAVAFALPWVRLEYIAISLAATAALCLVEWSGQERAPGAPLRERAGSARSVKALVPFFAAGAGILVYFAYNKLVFGGIVPVSGATKAAWSQLRWEQEGGYSLTQNFLDILQIEVFDYELLVALEICAYLLLVWWFARRSHNREDWLLLVFLVGVSGLAVGHLAKFGQTVLTIHPSLGPWPWYFVPAYLMMALIIPIRCYVAIYFIRRFIGSRSQHATNILNVGIVLAGAAFLLAKTDFATPFRWVEASRNSTRVASEWTEAVYGGTQLMNRALPEDSVVGSWEAGVIGYFSRFPVVNLDGLVNSYDYFHGTNVARDGYASWDEKLISLHREFGITHFATPERFEGSLPSTPDRMELQIRPIGLPADDNTVARTWERIEPHFDHQSDSIGLIVDGRLAQAFVRNCAPNKFAALSWVGQGEETVAKAWAQTQTGLCVATFVLPHNALPPVSVETMDLPVSDYLARLLGDNRPVIRSDWNVYLVGNSLIYKKEQCSLEDVEPKFFLHLYPVDVNDLPGHRKQYGFDNLDFAFRDHRRPIKEGVCVARRELPDYGIAALHTGQFTGEGRIWEGRFDIPL